MLDTLLKNIESLFISLLVLLNLNSTPSETLIENKVIKVIDGDTIEVVVNKKIEKIRLIGLDTPETVDPRKELECFGIEASEELKNLVEGKIVKLDSDESQDNKDRYGRLLRYVILDDKNINLYMIENGYGFEYTFKSKYKYQKEFKEAERNAQKNNLGLWSNEVCEYSN
jgi:micrococcal nuclease